MRRFNFNNFKKNNRAIEPEKIEKEPVRRYSAYRTIISRHEATAARLKDEPVAVIESNN